MRVLLVAPWFRTLAVLHARAITALGHEVRIVTTDAHYASAEVPLPGDSLVLPHAVRGASATAFVHARRELRRFAPHRSFVDDTWDLRFAALAPRYDLLVHDWAPHDDAHRTTAAKRAARRLIRTRARKVVFFSHASAVAAGRPAAPVLPLGCEADASSTPPVGATRAREPRLLLLGRIEPYKQTRLVVDAWCGLSAEQRGGGTLVVLGDGSGDLPPDVDGLQVRRGRYSYAEAVEALQKSWVNVCYYRGGTQSAVQVLGYAVGTPALLSDEPGLRESASPADRIVPSDADLPAALAAVVRGGPPSTEQVAAVHAHAASTNGAVALQRAWAGLLAR